MLVANLVIILTGHGACVQGTCVDPAGVPRHKNVDAKQAPKHKQGR